MPEPYASDLRTLVGHDGQEHVFLDFAQRLVSSPELGHLRTLPAILMRNHQNDVREIVRRFQAVYRRLHGSVCFPDAQIPEMVGTPVGRTFVVTHQYSKTVRAVLKDGLFELFSERVIACEKGFGDLQQASIRERVEKLRAVSRDEEKYGAPVVWLLERSEPSQSTRIMEYELKEQPEYRGFANVAVGGVEALSRMTADGDLVVVVLGAEAIDSDRTVLHPRGPSHKEVQKLLDLVKCEVAVLIVAESQKFLEHSFVETSLPSLQWDGLHLIAKKLIGLYIDETTWPLIPGGFYGRQDRLELVYAQMNDELPPAAPTPSAKQANWDG